MDESAADGITLGVVGETGERADVVPDTVDHWDGSVADLPATDLDVVVAVGTSAAASLAEQGTTVPVLPVDAGRGVRSVPVEDVTAAIEGVADGEGTTENHPIVDVLVGGKRRTRALFDVTLMTSEPAHISEYAVQNDGERVMQVRADGVVVATPAGSPDYARAAGGPVVAPGTDVGVVVPVAPFVTDPDHWILPLSDVSLSVERDNAPVSLTVDGQSAGTVAAHRKITLSVERTLPMIRVPESQSPFR